MTVIDHLLSSQERREKHEQEKGTNNVIKSMAQFICQSLMVFAWIY
jgi:hypothetical protein